MLQIEQWVIEIQHICGTDNTLEDILSRKPPHVNNPVTTNLTQCEQIMLHAMGLSIHNCVNRQLRNLAILQNTDPLLQVIKD
jgi:hypothetical protein